MHPNRPCTLWISMLLILLGSISAAASTPKQDLAQRCEQEVVELHQFFQDWFNGTLRPTDAEFERFAKVLAEDFIIIPPSGRAVTREPLLQGLKQAHGRWQGGDTSGQGKIWIENFTVRLISEPVIVITYEEWQEFAGESKSRVSTAIFHTAEGMPHGVQWRHLQETNLP